MKKILIIIIIIFVILGSSVFKYIQNNEKYKDVNFTASHYITSGLFNKYKLFKINDLKLSFSDGTMAIVTVSGLLDKAPHDLVKYNILLEKKNNGTWKVAKVYS